MNFKESISTCLSKYAVFTGRAVKSEFYWWPVFLLLILIIVGAINAQLSRLLIIIMIIPTLAVTTRRLHDMNFSGWWQLAYLRNCSFDDLLYSGFSRSEYFKLQRKNESTHLHKLWHCRNRSENCD